MRRLLAFSLAFSAGFVLAAEVRAQPGSGIVYTATYDGRIFGLSTRDGSIVQRARMRAGINACPAVGDGTLLVGAGADHPAHPAPVFELVAYAIGQR